MRDPAALDALVDSLGDLDVLVNNAGANLVARNEWNPEVFEEAVRINLFGAFQLAVRCKDRLAGSRLEGGGSVLNIASMSADASLNSCRLQHSVLPRLTEMPDSNLICSVRRS